YGNLVYYDDESSNFGSSSRATLKSAMRDAKGGSGELAAKTSHSFCALYEMASISASVKAPGTMVSGMRSWLPALPVKAVTNGPGPSPFEDAPSTRTEIELSSARSLSSSSRLLPSRM